MVDLPPSKNPGRKFILIKQHPFTILFFFGSLHCIIEGRNFPPVDFIVRVIEVSLSIHVPGY